MKGKIKDWHDINSEELLEGMSKYELRDVGHCIDCGLLTHVGVTGRCSYCDYLYELGDW